MSICVVVVVEAQLARITNTRARAHVSRLSVKLKWLNSDNATVAAGEAATSLETHRAGRPIAFECAAAAQPRPRVRWFRWIATQAAPNTKQQQHLSEQQIRRALASASMASLPEFGLQLQRVELPVANAHKHNASRLWRVDASTSSRGPHELVSRLSVDRAEPAMQGLYECEASVASADVAAVDSTQQQQQQQQQDSLKRLFGLVINGK